MQPFQTVFRLESKDGVTLGKEPCLLFMRDPGVWYMAAPVKFGNGTDRPWRVGRLLMLSPAGVEIDVPMGDGSALEIPPGKSIEFVSDGPVLRASA